MTIETTSSGDAVVDLNELAQKIRAGYEPTPEEVRITIQNLRTNRTAASTTSKAKVAPMGKEEIEALFKK